MNKCKRFSRQLALAAVCFLIILNSLIIPVKAESGKCGDGVKWKLESGVLTVSGRGTMDNYANSSDIPWYHVRDDITSVVVKSGVQDIGDLAFYNCLNLKNVTLDDSVTRIGQYAFMNCENLLTIKMSSKIKHINSQAFKMCKSLTSITFPQGLETIGYEAFYMCSSLKVISVPSSVYNIGNCAFTHCSSMLQARIDASIGKLPDWMFYGCNSLVNVYLSSSISSIGTYSFYDCDDLETVYSYASDSIVNELENGIKNDLPSFKDVVKANETTSSTIKPDNQDDLIVDAIENENVTISGNISSDKTGVIDATIKNQNGWNEVIDKTNTYLDTNSSFNENNHLDLNVSLEGNQKVDGSFLEELAGTSVDLTINNSIIINCSRLDSDKNYKDYDFGYTLEKIQNPSGIIKDVLKDSIGYSLRFNDNIDFEITVKITLNDIANAQIATLYQKSGSKYEKAQSVHLNENVANFYLKSYDKATKYLIGLDVSGDNTNALIPDDDYNGLTDAYGNRYAITGRDSKWGLDINQVVLIMVIVLVVVVCAVGGSMYIMNKRNIELAMIKEEVFSKSYKMRKNKKK